MKYFAVFSQGCTRRLEDCRRHPAVPQTLAHTKSLREHRTATEGNDASKGTLDFTVLLGASNAAVENTQRKTYTRRNPTCRQKAGREHAGAS